MDPQAETARRRTRSGRWIVLVIVVFGAGMGLAGLLLRAARGPSLPLKPGALVVVTCETATRGGEDGAADPHWTRFSFAVAPSSELVANLGSLFTGKMPRESGLVREGDTLRGELPTLAEIAKEQGFAAAAFVALDADAEKRAGLSRGFSSVDARAGVPDAELAAKAAEWLLARGTAPSLAWLHVRSEDAVDGFVSRLHEHGVDEHAVVVTTGPLAPEAGGRIRLALRLPVALLPLRVDPEPVSLVDVFASVAEAFGIRAPDGIGTPFLLHPDVHGPHFVLSTRPLSGAFADADEVWLHASKVEYENAPRTGSREPDTPLAKELRGVVEDGFGYRFEEVELAALLPADPSRPAGPGAPSRVWIARARRRR
jgi:hypothetical protein